jgi:hypothetical protein
MSQSLRYHAFGIAVLAVEEPPPLRMDWTKLGWAAGRALTLLDLPGDFDQSRLEKDSRRSPCRGNTLGGRDVCVVPFAHLPKATLKALAALALEGATDVIS